VSPAKALLPVKLQLVDDLILGANSSERTPEALPQVLVSFMVENEGTNDGRVREASFRWSITNHNQLNASIPVPMPISTADKVRSFDICVNKREVPSMQFIVNYDRKRLQEKHLKWKVQDRLSAEAAELHVDHIHRVKNPTRWQMIFVGSVLMCLSNRIITNHISSSIHLTTMSIAQLKTCLRGSRITSRRVKEIIDFSAALVLSGSA
jgi:hypothetical protein